MKNLIVILTIITACTSCVEIKRSKQEVLISNIETFGRLYGYVKYFHPSSAAYKVDWDEIAFYGVQKVQKVKNNQELLQTLNEIFTPIASGVLIFNKNNPPEFDISGLKPKNKKFNKLIFWEHQGLGFGMLTKFYSSDRIEINFNEKMDDVYPKFEDYYIAELGNNLMAYIPLVLYSNGFQTYPLRNNKLYEALQDSIIENYPKSQTGDNINVRLANVIIYWNVLKHFYPHFYKKQRLEWNNSFNKFIEDACIAKDKYDFLHVMQKHIATLNDGHAIVRMKKDTTIRNFAPVKFGWIQDSLIIKDVCDTALTRLRKGDIIQKINNVESFSYLDSMEQYISASTLSYNNYISANKLMIGSENSELLLTIKRGNYIFENTLKRAYPLREYRTYCSNNKRAFKVVKPKVYYINLGSINQKQFDSLLPILADAKSIIFDISYPKIPILSHLLNSPDTNTSWSQIPINYYPDYSKTNWIKRGWELKPEKPHLNGKIIFLSRKNNISYAETILSIIKSYKLGTIIGENSAGTNGNVNFFRLYGDYSITWTGSVCVMQTGEPYWGNGIEPDIIVRPTIEGLRQGKDEILEKAIELALQNE